MDLKLTDKKSKKPFGTNLAHRANWVFDLDNTLYSADSHLFSQIDERMGSFIAEFMNIDRIKARKIQKGYLKSHGTTLRGLMDCHGVDPVYFMDYVHDIDVTPVTTNDSLKKSLSLLKGRRLIFTNGSKGHAERVLDRLGIVDQIDGIFDVAEAEYIPKPQGHAYDCFMNYFGISASGTVMVEDMARNLTPAKERGMDTVWVRTGSAWGELDHNPDHIDLEITDLTDWLHFITKDQTA